jgi:hypothetical protein
MQCCPCKHLLPQDQLLPDSLLLFWFVEDSGLGEPCQHSSCPGVAAQGMQQCQHSLQVA